MLCASSFCLQVIQSNAFGFPANNWHTIVIIHLVNVDKYLTMTSNVEGGHNDNAAKGEFLNDEEFFDFLSCHILVLT